MLYECIECKHEISSDAWRCPNCGCKDAGELAQLASHAKWRAEREFEKDRDDPGWREREAAEQAARKKKEAKKIFILELIELIKLSSYVIISILILVYLGWYISFAILIGTIIGFILWTLFG